MSSHPEPDRTPQYQPFSDLVRAAGLRESSSRAYSTTTLRAVLETLVQQGLIVQNDTAYDCARFIREQSLREASRRGVLDRVATAIRAAAHPYLRYSNQGLEAAWFDFRVALERGDLHNAATLLVNCASHDAERFAQDNPLVQAVCEPFDPAWLEAISPTQRCACSLGTRPREPAGPTDVRPLPLALRACSGARR